MGERLGELTSGSHNIEVQALNVHKTSQNVITRFIHFINITLVFMKKMNESKTESTKQRPSFDVVFAECFAPQGNGGNWAATLSWVSEQINVRVQEAISLSQQGKRVGLYLGCMTGGSSGSVTTAVLSSILSNKNILPAKSAQDILSPEEATLSAKAPRYVAFSVDLNLRELVRFFGQAFWTQGSNLINQNALENLFGKDTPHVSEPDTSRFL